MTYHDDAGHMVGAHPTYGELIDIDPGDVKAPFAIRRVYWLFDTVADAVRGKHAHRELKQLIMCVTGSATVMLDDGTERKEFVLDTPAKGLTVGPSTWRELHSFSPGAVVVVLASLPYDETDYIRDYAEFQAVKAA